MACNRKPRRHDAGPTGNRPAASSRRVFLWGTTEPTILNKTFETANLLADFEIHKRIVKNGFVKDLLQAGDCSINDLLATVVGPNRSVGKFRDNEGGRPNLIDMLFQVATERFLDDTIEPRFSEKLLKPIGRRIVLRRCCAPISHEVQNTISEDWRNPKRIIFQHAIPGGIVPPGFIEPRPIVFAK
jgi:hypothetical protein